MCPVRGDPFLRAHVISRTRHSSDDRVSFCTHVMSPRENTNPASKGKKQKQALARTECQSMQATTIRRTYRAYSHLWGDMHAARPTRPLNPTTEPLRDRSNSFRPHQPGLTRNFSCPTHPPGRTDGRDIRWVEGTRRRGSAFLPTRTVVPACTAVRYLYRVPRNLGLLPLSGRASRLVLRGELPTYP